MGQKPTEEELFQMISEVDDNMSGSIGALCLWPAHGRSPIQALTQVLAVAQILESF